MTELLVATRNEGKMREIRELLKEFDVEIKSLLDYADMPEIVEDGATFYDNAVKKAAEIARHTGRIVMGEDSGLEVDALDGRPGVYSARYAGEGASDEDNNRKLLEELKGVPLTQRSARYRSFVALASPEDLITVVDGVCEGLIAEAPRGRNGFGYDPLFVVPPYGRTFGEMEPALKARMSHRAKALEKFKDTFRQVIEHLR